MTTPAPTGFLQTLENIYDPAHLVQGAADAVSAPLTQAQAAMAFGVRASLALGGVTLAVLTIVALRAVQGKGDYTKARNLATRAASKATALGVFA